MAELTPEQRRQIYEEEQSKKEETENGSFVKLLLLNFVAALTLAGLVSMAKQKNHLKIENIRKAYSGIDTEEYK